jgi:uncharacterized phiE125 gp8 family phage protein
MSRITFTPVSKGTALTSLQYEALLPLADVKKHLRMDHDDDDDIITIYRDAAINHAMHETGRIFTSASDYVVYLSGFPGSENGYTNKIQMHPVTAVAVKYHNGTDWQTLDPESYDLDIQSEPSRILFLSEPDVNEDMLMPVKLEITGGHSSIPKPIVSGILLFIGHLYENRQDVIIGTIATLMPQASGFIFQSQRVFY